MRWRGVRRRSPLAAWFLVALCATHTAIAGTPEAVELVVGPPDQVRALRITADQVQTIEAPAGTPLGSLWKLFVYAYLVDRGVTAPDYQCTGSDPGEESYCCSPGESIGREQALAKSCGLYFSPQRLNLQATHWKTYWGSKTAKAPAWLTDLHALTPATNVSVVSLLTALASIDETTRQQTMHALQRVTLEPRARPLLSHAGAQLSVKTWSWHDHRGQRVGGFAGWLANGTPIWLRGPGTSATVIEAAAPWIAPHLAPTQPGDHACVVVQFFKRYPLRELESGGRPAASGLLGGHVRARFRNGQTLVFKAAGKLRLLQTEDGPRIEGRFGLNEYIARVVQREAAAQPTAAARALAVAARTYLARHADFVGGCYRIDDDSRTQRVSPSPPSHAALAAAQWSDGLILNGVDGRFHATQARARQLAWQDAVEEAQAGWRWDEILEHAYGKAGFGLIGDADAGECQVLPPAERWLAARQARWRAQLETVPGFEPPTPLPRICLLLHGAPYADVGRGRIYATGVGTANERLTVVHEYLHFGLSHHPRGRDEAFVERTAHWLLGLP